MKRNWVIVLFAAALATTMMRPGTLFAEAESSVNLGVGTSNILPHCKATLYIIEYERELAQSVTGLVRFSEVHYRFDDGQHVEEGRPTGGDLGARYYTSRAMKGFYVGGSVGYWRSDWVFTHNRDLPSEFQGNGKSESIRANLDIGGRFPIGSSSVSIMPAVNVGRYFSHITCEYTSPASRVGTACNEESEVKYYAFLAVTAGIAF